MTPPETSGEARPLMSERRVALLCALLAMVGSVSLGLFTPAMPLLVQAFDSTDSVVKMTISFYFAGFAVAQLVCGPLSDGFGRKPVIIAFMGVYVLASLVALLSPTMEVLIAARFVQGIGGAAGVAISRALVRDLFTGEAAARIMSTVVILMGLAPPLAPTLGGLLMMSFGWHAIFIAMLLAGLFIVMAVHLWLAETVTRDPSRIRPSALARSYATLLRNSYFMASSITFAGSMGALYTQLTLLPFILMDRVGMTPVEYGLGMLMQSGFFFLGSVALRIMMMRVSSVTMVPVGLCFIGTGSILTATLLHIYEPGFLLVMMPIGIYTFGIPMVMPAMSTAAMAPFPHIAGSASALLGFMQMSGGLVGGLISTFFTDQVIGLTVTVPIFGLISILSYLFWRRLPEPVVPARPS